MRRISHGKARHLINYSADFPLKAKKQAQLETHLKECTECLQYFKGFQKMEKELSQIMQRHWGKRGMDFSVKTIQTRSRRLKTRKIIWNSVKALGTTAFVIVLLFGIGLFFRQRDVPISSDPAAAETQTMSASQESEHVISGQWIAITDFGKIVFTVNDSGKRIRITRTDLKYSEWTCGSTVHSGDIVDASDWEITDNRFQIYTPFDRYSQSGIYIDGVYDVDSEKFSGTWEEFSDATICSGMWEASLSIP
jgi:hypothetical protein